ncbi:hypothetical protein RND81_10G074600 [Saponaria officinalis]|uniref:Aminotransferase-like plant mobile domain-containing protein n=1 Tax=Saponaria officinalis TaxID=3572 RepID=A0AAW1HZ41_SAPOF
MESFYEHWCPKTNTLETATGEASISLWDIRTLANLPITGLLYEEVVPSLAELLDSSPDEKPHLPPSYKYLFAAFHVILSKSGSKTKVNFEDWCRFWFKRASKYSSSNVPISKKDFVSYGDAEPWSDTTHAVFQVLDVPEPHHGQTYLATFLSCWLCSFVLPVRDLVYIQTGVFKVA